MKRRPPLKLEFSYSYTPERRCVSLEPDGMLCIPVLGHDSFKRKWIDAPLHVHAECLEISLCLRGDLEFELGGSSYPFRPDTVFVSRPDEVHRMKAYPRSMSKYWMFFRIPKKGFPFLKLPPPEANWLKERLRNLPNRVFPATKRLHASFRRILQLYDTLPANTPGRSLQMRAAATELLLSIVEASSSAVNTPAYGRVEALIREMRNNPGKDYPIDELSEKAAISPSNLALRFKAVVGMPPHSFLMRCRIDRAKRMLAESDAKVADISKKLGYPSSQHFATQFKSSTGKTPREWKYMQYD